MGPRIDLPEVMRQCDGLPPLARHVLLLVSLGCEPSYESLAALTGASVRSIRRAITASQGRLEVKARGRSFGQIVILSGQNGRSSGVSFGQIDRSNVSRSDNLAERTVEQNGRNPRQIGDYVGRAVRRATCNNVVVNNKQTKGVWGETAEELLGQFPAITRAFPDLSPTLLAQRVAMSARSERPGAYFAHLMRENVTPSRKQAIEVEATVAQLIKGAAPVAAAPMEARELHACSHCNSRRLRALGGSRVQCSDCGRLIDGVTCGKKEISGETGEEKAGAKVGKAVVAVSARGR